MERVWLEAADHVKDLTSKPEAFLEPSNCESHFNNAKIITKVLYDAAKMMELTPVFANDRNKGKFCETVEYMVDGGGGWGVGGEI